MGKLKPKKKEKMKKGVLKRESLAEVLRLVNPAVSKKGIVEQTDHFLFYPDKIVGTDGKLFISVPFVTGVKGEHSVPADKLYGLVDKLGTKNIKIKMEKNQMVFSSGKVSFGLSHSKGGKMFEAIEGMKVDELDWETLPKHFLSAMNLCIFCVSKDLSKPELTCLFFEGKDVFASDGYRVAWYKGEEEVVDPFLLRGFAAAHLVKYDPIEYCLISGMVFFRNAAGVIFGSAVVFPTKELEAKGAFPKKKGKKLDLPQEKLKEVLGKSVVLLEDDFILDREVNISFDGKEVTCYVKKGDVGWFTETLKTKKENVKVAFKINPDFLMQAMDESAELYFVNEDKILLVASGGKFNHIIGLS